MICLEGSLPLLKDPPYIATEMSLVEQHDVHEAIFPGFADYAVLLPSRGNPESRCECRTAVHLALCSIT